MDYMRALFGDFIADQDEVEARCMLAMCFFVGNHFVAADNGPHSRRKLLRLALTKLES
jgi:hypothetical protein